jgi:hypothetical protein
MPLPEPRRDENKDDFIDRCISNSIIKREFRANQQRIAVCNRLYELGE